MAEVILETADLGRAFGGVQAVDAVNFSLNRGEVRAIIGPNGAGKSTFVGLLSGRIRPDTGTIRFEGHDITHLAAHRRVRAGIAYTFQITNIYPSMTLRENLGIALQSRLRRAADIAAATDDIATRIGLMERLNDRAGDLSYGHQRLLEVGMGLALAPKLLILDEPTQGLSDGEIGAFSALVRSLVADTTILLIEHNMDVVMALARRITVFDRGRILAEGTPSEITSSPLVQAAYLGGVA